MHPPCLEHKHGSTTSPTLLDTRFPTFPPRPPLRARYDAKKRAMVEGPVEALSAVAAADKLDLVAVLAPR